MGISAKYLSGIEIKSRIRKELPSNRATHLNLV
jgi:hypothetical protein